MVWSLVITYLQAFWKISYLYYLQLIRHTVECGGAEEGKVFHRRSTFISITVWICNPYMYTRSGHLRANAHVHLINERRRKYSQ